MKYQSIKIKVKKDIGYYAPNSVITIPTDQHGTPTDPFFRRILKDAEIDQCVEIIRKPSKVAGSSKSKADKSPQSAKKD